MKGELQHASEGQLVVMDNMPVLSGECQHTQVYVPLNSTQVTAGQLRQLGTKLGVPMSSAVKDVRVMIEAKLRELTL